MVKLISLREMWYDGKTRWPGDEFEADETDAHILSAPDLPGGQKARRADVQPAATPPAPRPAPPQPLKEGPSDTSVKPMGTDSGLVPPGSRRYRRRNMTSED